MCLEFLHIHDHFSPRQSCTSKHREIQTRLYPLINKFCLQCPRTAKCDDLNLLQPRYHIWTAYLDKPSRKSNASTSFAKKGKYRGLITLAKISSCAINWIWCWMRRCCFEVATFDLSGQNFLVQKKMLKSVKFTLSLFFFNWWKWCDFCYSLAFFPHDSLTPSLAECFFIARRVYVCVCGGLFVCVCAWIWLRCLLTTINIWWPLSILPLARAPFRTCGRCLSSHVTLNPQQLPAGISRKVEATLWDHHARRFTAILVFRRRAAGISVLQPFPWILIPKTEMHFLSYFILLLFDDEAKKKKKIGITIRHANIRQSVFLPSKSRTHEDFISKHTHTQRRTHLSFNVTPSPVKPSAVLRRGICILKALPSWHLWRWDPDAGPSRSRRRGARCAVWWVGWGWGE